jgi:hypothetical protein
VEKGNWLRLGEKVRQLGGEMLPKTTTRTIHETLSQSSLKAVGKGRFPSLISVLPWAESGSNRLKKPYRGYPRGWLEAMSHGAPVALLDSFGLLQPNSPITPFCLTACASSHPASIYGTVQVIHPIIQVMLR